MTLPSLDSRPATQLPIYRHAFDFEQLIREFPLPDVFEKTVWCWSPERIRALQEQRFLSIVGVGWKNPFYRRRWNAAGLIPGDIRSLDDIVKLPTYTSDDVKESLEARPPLATFTMSTSPTCLRSDR